MEKMKGGNKMKNKPDKKSDCRMAWQSVVTVVAAVILSVFVAVALIGFQWSLLLDTFRNLWLILIIVIVVISGLFFAVNKYPLKTSIIILLGFCFLFLLASPKNQLIAQEIRELVNNAFDVSYLIGSITFLALAVAFATALKSKNK